MFVVDPQILSPKLDFLNFQVRIFWKTYLVFLRIFFELQQITVSIQHSFNNGLLTSIYPVKHHMSVWAFEDAYADTHTHIRSSLLFTAPGFHCVVLMEKTNVHVISL